MGWGRHISWVGGARVEDKLREGGVFSIVYVSPVLLPPRWSWKPLGRL